MAARNLGSGIIVGTQVNILEHAKKGMSNMMQLYDARDPRKYDLCAWLRLGFQVPSWSPTAKVGNLAGQIREDSL